MLFTSYVLLIYSLPTISSGIKTTDGRTGAKIDHMF